MFKTVSIIIASVASIIAIGYFLIMTVGKPIGTDLTVIGKSKPALVLAYENFSPNGGDALNRLRQVRDALDSQLEFVVADLGTPQGRKVADSYQLGDGQAVLLKPDGELFGVTNIPKDEGELRNLLQSKLAELNLNP